MKKNLFKEKMPIPSVSNSFCIFLDVLGFSKKITDCEDEKASNIQLSKFYNISSKTKGQFEPDYKVWEIKRFTDNIILGCAINNQRGLDSEDYFGIIIGEIQEYQLSMVLNDYFIRGGWTLGELYMDEDIVYGKAIIDAYLIESKMASVPRILLSTSMMQLIDKHINYYHKDVVPPQKIDILVDGDLNYFVNYLATTIVDSDTIDYDRILKHKEVIESRLLLHKNELNILEKYRWAAEYHNYFCETFVKNCDSKYIIENIKIKKKFSIIGRSN